MSSAAAAAATFRTAHGRPTTGVWSAPGRVNLIGEHTDYNDGYVLPFALPHRLAVAASPRDDQVITVATLGADGSIQESGPLEIPNLRPRKLDGWAAYPAGVAWVLRDQGFDRGADLVIASDVPSGAGLSSSHALECAVALALLGLAGVELDDEAEAAPTRQQVARWVQKSENDFVGAPTGLLDQTACLWCSEAHVLFLDVRSGKAEQVPFDPAAAGVQIMVIDTRTKHSHREGGYGDRRNRTERASGLLGVNALRDVRPDDLGTALGALPEELGPLVRHVVTENQRVLDLVELLNADRLGDIGALLDASHESLRADYRVSSVELDLAVDSARSAGALGARMTGGGFGGSAIALVRQSDVDIVGNEVVAAFERAGLRRPHTFVAAPSRGAGRDDPFRQT